MSASAVLLAADVEWSDYRWWLLVTGGLIAFFYGAIPLLILAQQKFEARPRMLRFDLDEYQWPEEIEELFTRAIGELTRIGFEIADSLFLPSAVPNVKTALVLLVNRTEQDSAMVTAMYAQPVTATSVKTLYVEFSTRFADGYLYDTNNSQQIGSFPRRDNSELHQLVSIRDAQTLYRVHQAVMDRDGRSRSQKVLRLEVDFDGDAVNFLQSAMQEEFEAARQNGYLRLTSDGERYRPTLKGACLMVWKELWPWKLVRKRQRDHRARTLLEELAREGVVVEA